MVFRSERSRIGEERRESLSHGEAGERSASRRPRVALFAPEHAEAMRTVSARGTGIVSEHIGRPSEKAICAVVGSADSPEPQGWQRAGGASREGSGGTVADRSSRRLVIYDYGCSIYI